MPTLSAPQVPEPVVPVHGGRSRGWARMASLALDLAGLLLWAVAVWVTWRKRGEPINLYDEGILLTDADLLLKGKVPFRDFYTNYPPGIFLLLAGALRIMGPQAVVERWLALGLRVCGSLLAGRLAGRLAMRRYSWMAAGLTMFWLSNMEMVATAYVAAVPLAVLAVLLVLRAHKQGRRGDYVLAGAMFGTVSWMRHDLFLYLLAVLGMGGAVLALWQRGWRAEVWRTWSWLPWLAGGTALTVVPFWTPWFVLAGPSQLVADLFLDQVRYVSPGRALPMPALLLLGHDPGLPFPLPAALRLPAEGALTLALLGPVLAALAVLLPARGDKEGRLAALLLGTVTLAVLPQLAGRTDLDHAVVTLPPTLIMMGAWIERLVAPQNRRVPRWALAALLIGLIGWPARNTLPPPPAWEPAPLPGLERASGLPAPPAPSRSAALAFIAENTHSPLDPIYVGVPDHRFIFVNDMVMYFLADRVGATRYMQFDPNIINRLDVQRHMAEELEASGVKIAILSYLFARTYEPNDSVKGGAGFLDQYLQAHFEVVRVVPPYMFLRRRGAPAR